MGPYAPQVTLGLDIIGHILVTIVLQTSIFCAVAIRRVTLYAPQDPMPRGVHPLVRVCGMRLSLSEQVHLMVPTTPCPSRRIWIGIGAIQAERGLLGHEQLGRLSHFVTFALRYLGYLTLTGPSHIYTPTHVITMDLILINIILILNSWHITLTNC